MLYRFGRFSLDTDKCELMSGGEAVAVEPQVLAVLRLLIENRDRLVSKDELVERVWNGRIISDAAVSSRIKAARRAVGDDGEAQAVIRTVSRLGFRFVAQVEAPTPASAPEALDAEPVEPPQRPSIAVLPFAVLGADPTDARIAEAIPHDLISELSRLRWLFVIARGSSFRFRGGESSIAEVRDALGVRYCLSGAVEVESGAMLLTVELCDTRDGGVLWSERFRSSLGGVHEIRDRIVLAVTGALELQIPLNEARRARLKSPESLDAWSAYHLGLHHMYRFSRDGVAAAMPLFERAIALEPGFARAHAGLSFTHFERAFLSFAEDRDRASVQARRCAEAGLELDPLDPFCNLVMGRAFWLGGELEASLPWLDRANRLNPNYAQAKYSRAWTETLLGDGAQGGADVEAAMRLSPLDPMAYAMLGVRAFGDMMREDWPQAALDGERAARAPGAHALIEMIAAVAHELNGDGARASAWGRSARQRQPSLGAADFFQAFPFRDGPTRRRIAQALERLEV
jgi:TolB-like protein/tetratricopeptide (TPR) repeat protein